MPFEEKELWKHLEEALLSCSRLAQCQIRHVDHDNLLFVQHGERPRLGFRWLIPDDVKNGLEPFLPDLIRQTADFLERNYPSKECRVANRYAFTVSRRDDDQILHFDGQCHQRTESAVFVLYIKEP